MTKTRLETISFHDFIKQIEQVHKITFVQVNNNEELEELYEVEVFIKDKPIYITDGRSIALITCIATVKEDMRQQGFKGIFEIEDYSS